MSKIAIISRPDEGVLIDVGGCSTLQEAIQHLTSTLQVSSQFWKGVAISLNLGELELNSPQVAQILAIAKGVGAQPSEVFAINDKTRLALEEHNVKLGEGVPVALQEASLEITTHQDLTRNEDQSEDEETGETESGESKDVPAVVYEADGAQGFASEGKSIESESDDQAATTKLEIDLAAERTETQRNEARRHRGEPSVDTAEEPRYEGDTAAIKRPKALPAVLYLKQTLRSGQMVSHKGHLVIVGDVNPGAEVMAEGDVTVWGALRGIAHAGIGGNINAEIRALKLQPIQIRIAHVIARAPDKPRLKYASKAGPEVAKIVDGKIRITRNNIE